MKKLIFMFTLMISLALGISWPAQEVQSQELLKIGILQTIEHTAFDENVEGIIAGLAAAGYVEGENITINLQNPSGDASTMHTMADILASESDYVFAIGTLALQAMANVTSEVPIFFSSVTDPVGAGAIDSLEQPGGNITGTSNLGPIKEQIDLMLKIEPDIQKVGILYNSGEVNSIFQVEMAVDLLEEMNLESITATVSQTSELQQVSEKLVKEADALFLVTDNTVHTGITLVGEIAKGAGLGIYGASINMIEENGLATYGLLYYDLGLQTADMFITVHENDIFPGDIPIEYADDLTLFVNEEYAAAIGIDPSKIQDLKTPD